MKKFKLMSYTTEVPAEKTVLDIERLMSRAGVKSIHKEFSADGEPIGFIFSIITKNGEMFFKMPCDAERVFAFLKKEHRYRYGAEKKVREQANRIAWRILYNTLSSQMTQLKLQQVVPEQVFLPYVYDPNSGATLFEKLESNGFKMIASQATVTKEL